MNTINNLVATRKQSGFTLIELVMVIVILGILAAFALPRFADLGGDARGSTLAGAEGSVKSAAAIAHSAWLARSEPNTIDLEGATGITMSPDGYPTSDEDGIGEAAQIVDDFTLTDGTDVDADNATIEVTVASGTCEFEYDPTTGGTTAFNDSGC